MRASEFITELFQQSKDWVWQRQSPNEAVAKFKVGDQPYRFLAYCEDMNGEGPWEIEFASERGDSRPTRFGLTGTGNSAEVMSTVVDIMRSFLKEHKDKITELVFSAKEGSRQGLYARMVQRLLPDWELNQSNETFFLIPPHQVDEEVLDEMPLPADWDPAEYEQGTTFKSRLAYALERAKKLGTGSSRVATTIEYQGRPTVLKIAKNQKGLAQNSVEADILSDGYASQLGILIPIIDYDEKNREPMWIHTEMATKASEKQLCNLMKCDSLSQLVNVAWAITGKKKFLGDYQAYANYMREKGYSDQDIETMTDYANTLADLNSNFDVELGDFARAANWGMYQNKPVIVDVGFNSNVLNQYYKR